MLPRVFAPRSVLECEHPHRGSIRSVVQITLICSAWTTSMQQPVVYWFRALPRQGLYGACHLRHRAALRRKPPGQSWAAAGWRRTCQTPAAKTVFCADTEPPGHRIQRANGDHDDLGKPILWGRSGDHQGRRQKTLALGLGVSLLGSQERGCGFYPHHFRGTV
jgi:hypothetical protein